MQLVPTSRSGEVPIMTDRGQIYLLSDAVEGVKQVKDFPSEKIDRSRPLRYLRQSYKNTDYSSVGDNGFSYYSMFYWTDPRNAVFNSQARNDAYNRAYRKAMDKISPVRAAAGVSLAQIGESASMIEKRGSQLLQLARLYQSRDVTGFIRYIHETILPTRSSIADNERKFKVMRRRFSKRRVVSRRRETHWNKVKASGGDLGGLWLESWFGWLPTLADLQACAEVLCEPISDQQITVGSTYNYSYVYKRVYPDVGFTSVSASGQGRVRLGFRVRVSNPNLVLLNSLGLLNPFTVGWDLIKMSWLVGWVGNFQQVMGSWTDFAGLVTTHAYVTDSISMKTEDFGSGVDPDPGSHRQTGKLFYMRRDIGSVPYPTLELNLPNKLSLTRGLTALSLMTQVLSKTPLRK